MTLELNLIHFLNVRKKLPNDIQWITLYIPRAEAIDPLWRLYVAIVQGTVFGRAPFIIAAIKQIDRRAYCPCPVRCVPTHSDNIIDWLTAKTHGIAFTHSLLILALWLTLAGVMHWSRQSIRWQLFYSSQFYADVNYTLIIYAVSCNRFQVDRMISSL